MIPSEDPFLPIKVRLVIAGALIAVAYAGIGLVVMGFRALHRRTHA